MKILVTGGAGFIGSHLVRRLLDRGDTVAVIDNFNSYYDPELKRENVAPHMDNPAFTLFENDITDTNAVNEIFDTFKPEKVCHLAARAGVRPSIEDPLLYEEVNVKGTINLLEAVKDIGLKNFVFASSSSVYGINTKVPFAETDPVEQPISPYAVTKRSGELNCFAYSNLYSIPITCLRFFTVYGESGRPDMALAKFTRLIYDGKEIEVYGDGTQQRDFTYVGDIIEGVLGAIDNPRDYEIINIGGSNIAELNDMIGFIETALGKKAEIKYLDKAPGDVPITYADVTKAGKLIGFAPKVTLDVGVARYVEWFLKREEAKK